MRYWMHGLAALALAAFMAACNTVQDQAGVDALIESATLPDGAAYEESWDGVRGMDSERCDYVGQEGRPASGWIHWVFATKGASTDALLVLGGSGSGEYEPGEPLTANVWHFYTPFFALEALSATIYLNGDPGRGGGLVISDYCPGVGEEELTVSKTADTSFTREHEWAVEKGVHPKKLYLYQDGSADQAVTWTVGVTYLGYEDSGFNVTGDIVIENTGGLDAVITSVDDVLAGEDIDVDCGVDFPYPLGVGETLTCSYDEDGYVEGTNVATVTTERDTYSGDAAITWGTPTSESAKTVDVVDISDLFGTVSLGSVTASDGDTFTYTKDFVWADYGRDLCGEYTYDNTAKVKLGGEVIYEDDASLKVYVECVEFAGETAWAANANTPLEYRFQDPGNWATYVDFVGFEVSGKTTTLFAGQTIDVGTVRFSPVADGYVTITLSLSGDWEFADAAENLAVQDYDSAPSGNPAPGLFDHKMDCDAALSTCTIVVPANGYYGVHANVGTWVPVDAD